MKILAGLSGFHTRAWGETLSPGMYGRVDQADRLLRSTHDARGVERLDALRETALAGGFRGAGSRVANAFLGAGVVAGAVFGATVGGGLGLGLGLVGGGALGAEFGVLLPKIVAESRLGRFVDRILETGKSGLPAPIPATPVEPAAPRAAGPSVEDVQNAMHQRYPHRLERVVLASGSDGVRELETSVTRQLLYESGERLDARVHTLWSYPTSQHRANDVAWDPASKSVYTRVGEGALAALDADGGLKWAFGGGAATCPPVVANGRVHLQTNGALHVLGADGLERWSYPLQASNSWNDRPPAVSTDGTVYVLDGRTAGGVHEPNMRLHALREGQESWHVDLVGNHTGDPSVLCGRDGTIYVTASMSERKGLFGDREERPYLLALRPDGTTKFKASVSYWPSYVASSLSEGPDGTLYACHGEQMLTAFTPEGKERWTYRLVDRVVTDHSSSHARLTQAPAVDDRGNVYVSTNTCASYPEGYLIALTPDGKEAWARSVPGGVSSRPHVGPDGLVYVTTERGELLSFDADGRQRSAAEVGDVSWSNFAFGDDGRLFLNTDRQIVGYQPDADRAYRVEPDAPGGASAPGSIADEGEYVVIGGVRLRKKTA